jgi:hypothetical protein
MMKMHTTHHQTSKSMFAYQSCHPYYLETALQHSEYRVLLDWQEGVGGWVGGLVGAGVQGFPIGLTS